MKRKAVIISQIVVCSLLCLSTIHLGIPKEQETAIQTQEPTVKQTTIKTTNAQSENIEPEYTYEFRTYWGGHLIFHSAIKECIIKTDGSNFEIKDERYECTNIGKNKYKITFVADSWTCPVNNILFHVDANFTYIIFESYSANKNTSKTTNNITTGGTIPSIIVPDDTTNSVNSENTPYSKSIPIPSTSIKDEQEIITEIPTESTTPAEITNDTTQTEILKDSATPTVTPQPTVTHEPTSTLTSSPTPTLIPTPEYTYEECTATIHAVQEGLIYYKVGNEYYQLQVSRGIFDRDNNQNWLYTYSVNGSYLGDQWGIGINPPDICNISPIYKQIQTNPVKTNDDDFIETTPTINSIQNGYIYIKINGNYEQLQVSRGSYDANNNQYWLYTYSANGTYLGEQWGTGLNPPETCNLFPLYTKK